MRTRGIGLPLTLIAVSMFLGGCQQKPASPSEVSSVLDNQTTESSKTVSEQHQTQTPVAIPTEGALGRPIEIYAFINGDNDLISQGGGSQGVVFSHELEAEVAKMGRGAKLTMYLDPNSLLAKEGESKDSMLTVHQGGELISAENLDETNSSDPATFQKLIAAIKPDPSVYRILILWGHGEGWRRVESFDFSHSQTSFSYQDIASLLPENSLDLVVFDACKMATLETLNAWAKVTRHVIATQMKLPVEGIRYDGLSEVLLSTNSGTELAQPTAVSIQLYEKLKKNTLDFHKTKGIFAPTVLYATSGVASLNAALAPALEAMKSKLNATLSLNDIALSSKPSFMLGLAGAKVPTVDLRGLVNSLDKKAQISGQAILESFKNLSPMAYGSLSLYFPETTATGLQDEAEVQYSKARSWTQGLANWNLVHNSGKQEGDTP